jgi:hypothetical protein
LSPAVACFTHATLPVSMSNAMMASLVGTSTPV